MTQLIACQLLLNRCSEFAAVWTAQRRVPTTLKDDANISSTKTKVTPSTIFYQENAIPLSDIQNVNLNKHVSYFTCVRSTLFTILASETQRILINIAAKVLGFAISTDTRNTSQIGNLPGTNGWFLGLYRSTQPTVILAFLLSNSHYA